MADVQIAVIDPEDTQLALAAPAEAVVNVAVPGVQGPIGLTGSVAIAQAGTAAEPGIRFESDTNTGIYSPGADQLAISTNGTGRLFVDASGNVGLGTGPTDIAGFKRIEIGEAGVSGGLLTLRSSGGAQEANISCSATGLAFTTNSYATPFDARASEIIFGTGSSGTERMRITSTGLVGLGTSSPSYPLHVVGQGYFSTKAVAGVGNEVAELNGGYVAFYNAAASNKWIKLIDDSSTIDAIGFSKSGSTATTWFPSGNVGIGTSSPATLLDISVAGGMARIGSGSGNNLIQAYTGAVGLGMWAGGDPRFYSTGSMNFSVNSTVGTSAPTGYVDAMTIDSSGRVGIGTTAPPGKLTVSTSSANPTAGLSTWTDGYSVVSPGGTSTSGGVGFSFNTTDNIGGISCATPGTAWRDLIYKASAHRFELGSSEAARIDSSGRLLVGTSSARGNFFNTTGQEPAFQVEGTTNQTARISVTRCSNDDAASLLIFGKSRSASVGGNTIVSQNDFLGGITFQGADGSEMVPGAFIFAEVDGTPGANDMPGRLVFSTTADGAATPTERLRIDSTGRVGIGTTSPGEKLDISSGTSGTAAVVKIQDPAGRVVQIASPSSSTEAYIGTTTNHRLDFYTNNTVKATLDSSGRLLVGTSTSRGAFFNGSGNDHQLQIEASFAASFVRNEANANAPFITLGKTRGSSSGATTIVSSGDDLGNISFQGADGSELVEAARISAVVDGTPGANDMPGRLVFSVTADGAASPTEALRISNDRSITVSDGGNVVLGTTTGTKIGTGTTQKLGFYNATPVVQPTAVADATDAATVITQLNDLLAKLRTLGIIAT